jgi:YggT family protein
MIILYTIVRLYEVVLLARIFMSWMNPDPNNQVVEWIYRLTEPVLAPVRRMLPISGMGIDFSPIVVFILIDIIKRVLVGPGVLF